MKIESDIALADASSFAADGTEADIDVRLARLSVSSQHGTRDGNWSLDGHGLWLDIPGLLRLRLTKGRLIEVDVNPSRPAEICAPFITGTALGILLQMRGDIVLHASCVAIDGQAVVLCGPAGAGKSVLAAALAQHGHTIVCDDLCRLVLDPTRGLLAMPEGAYARLWPPDAAAMSFRDGIPIRLPVAKSRFTCRSTAEPVPVVAIYEMDKAPHADACTVKPLLGLSRIEALSRQTYRPTLIDAMPGGASRQFATAATLLQRAPLFSFDYFPAWDLLPAAVARLETHVGQLGQ